MDPIIRAADVASVRRLQRPGVAQAAAAAPAATPRPPVPARPPAPPPDAWQALEQRGRQLEQQEEALQRQLTVLEAREQALRHQEAALQERERAVDADLASRQALAEQRGLALGEQKAQALAATMQQGIATTAAAQSVRWQQACEALLANRQELLAGAEDALVEIVHGALCRILGETAASRAAITAVVDGMLNEVRDGEPLRVFVHPQDIELLHGAYGSGSDERVRLVADAGLTLGGCMVETARGTLDARLELQLQGLRHALQAARSARASVQVAD